MDSLPLYTAMWSRCCVIGINVVECFSCIGRYWVMSLNHSLLPTERLLC